MREILQNLCKYKGGRNFGGTSNGRPRPYVSKYPAENECIKFYGIPQRQECADDVR